MLDICSCSIELNPRVRLARRVDIDERNSRHRKARLLQQRLRTECDIHRSGEHTDTAAIVLKDITLRKRRSSVLVVIIDRIGELRRLCDPNGSGCAQCCFVELLTCPLGNDRELSTKNLVGRLEIGLGIDLGNNIHLRKQLDPLTRRKGEKKDLALGINTAAFNPAFVSL